jgi:hypothetical protein
MVQDISAAGVPLISAYSATPATLGIHAGSGVARCGIPVKINQELFVVVAGYDGAHCSFHQE